MTAALPRMSIVLATDRFETISRTLRALQAQTIASELEVVLVPLSGEPLDVPAAALSGFGSIHVVESSGPCGLAPGRRAGVRAASAPIVAIGESHAFPRPEWAARVLARHSEGWTVVVPGFCNANPEGAISWSNLLLDYGGWTDAVGAGEIGRLPPYNTSFERTAALSLEATRAEAFAPGYDLAVDVRAAGWRVFFEPSARVDHVNVSTGKNWIPQRFVSSRAHAAIRSRHWPVRRRALYALGSPLIPAVCLARVAREVAAARKAQRLPRATIPAMVAGAIAEGAGELTAFVSGPGSSEPRSDQYELHKVAYTRMASG